MSVNELASTRPMFTEHFHRDVYPAIDPTNPALALTGKTVLVTGGGRGIGVSIVEAFAKAQAKSIILTGRTESSLVAAKEKFTKAFPGVQFIASAVDIGVPESVDAMFKSLNGKVEHIDVLVNNAGVNSEYGVRIGESNVEKLKTKRRISTQLGRTSWLADSSSSTLLIIPPLLSHCLLGLMRVSPT